MKALHHLLLSLPLLASVSCGSDPATANAGTASPGTAGSALPSAGGAATATSDAARTAPAGPLAFRAQEGWVTEGSTSSMRAAQYRLPGGEGVGDATVVVFFFGAAGGGGFEANVARWASQFEQPSGAPTLQTARESTRQVAGMPVREVALEGTYVAETFPGSGQRVREEGWALRGAMVDAAVGPYYVRLLGPVQAVEHWEPSFRAFISSLGTP
jgi:hypothetical protein